jgi:hypothetical protein
VELHVHTAVDALGVRPAAQAARRRAGFASSGALRLTRARARPVRLRPVSGKAGIIGHRRLKLDASRIVLSEGRPGRRYSGEA